MNKPLKLLAFISIIVVSGLMINAVRSTATDTERISQKDSNKSEPRKSTSDLYEIKALKLPEYLEFSGEKVPLTDTEVYERVDREIHVNTYWQSNGLLLFKRANKYFPIIEPILAQHGIPDDFKYLAVIESGLQNVTSPAGAKGFWQIMKTTGKEYDLEINSNVDERYHLEKATTAACKYLLASKKRFGSWTLAASAYNAGNKKISDRLSQQETDNYYDLLLNMETARYVPRIIAVKEILTHPSKYGFSFDDEDLYQPIATYEVRVDTPITSITRFAKDNNMTYKAFKNLNPWLREQHLNNKSKKVYFMKVVR